MSLIPIPVKPKLTKKQKDWLDRMKYLLYTEFSFEKCVQTQIIYYFEYLIEAGATVPAASIQMQLAYLSQFSGQEQIAILSETILRGWKNLSYSCDKAKEQKRGSARAIMK